MMGHLVSSNTARDREVHPGGKKKNCKIKINRDFMARNRIYKLHTVAIKQKLSLKVKTGGHNSAAVKMPQIYRLHRAIGP